jgi:hypothetical protein
MVGLAPCGDNDCYVVGDPTRMVRGVVSLPSPTPKAEQTLQAQGDGLDADSAMEEGEEIPESDYAGSGANPYYASLWVDTVDHSVRRMESRNGVVVILGPYVSYERVSVPKWWSIEEPGKRPVRFDVEGVIEVNAPAAAFSKTWLMAPVNEAQPSDGGSASIKEALPAVSGSAPADVDDAPPESDYDSPDAH